MSALCSIDLSVLNTRFPTGISRYARKIVEGLLAIEQSDTRWLTLGSMEPVGRPERRERHLAYELPWHDIDASRRTLSSLLAIEGVDAHFSPYYPLPDKASVPTFLTIFDLLPLKHPEWFPNASTQQFFDGPLRASARRATHLFAISEATKSDVVDLYGIAPERITVTHLAPIIDPMGFPDTGRPVEEPYFLCVCTLEPRKNLERTLQAFELLIERDPDLPHKLVIVGAYGWKSETLQQNASNLGERVNWTGYLPDSELAAYYRHAAALVFVSLAEGFGLPIAEAMSCGVPVLTSNCSSMPEVAGDAGVYCNPEDNESIADGWGKLVGSDFRTRSARSITAKSKSFNWISAADITYSRIFGLSRQTLF